MIPFATHDDVPDTALATPWTEAPTFARDLDRRTDLSEDQRRLLLDFHRDGYVVLDGVVEDDLVEQVKREVAGQFRPDVTEGPASYYRVQDAWKTSPAARALALHAGVLEPLRLLYQREPIPFQTLDFLYGSQQGNHSDAILFNSLPGRFMCGVWVALEDVDADNGPLFYHPGSHRLPEYFPQHFVGVAERPDDFVNFRYPGLIRELMDAGGFPLRELHVKKGSLLIWASNLVHGGMPRRSPSRTRWSQVTHYYFADCVYFVPLYSNVVTGEFHLRDVEDFRGTGTIEPTFNGAPITRVPVGDGRFRITIGPTPKRVRRDGAALPAPRRIARLPAADLGEVAYHIDILEETSEEFRCVGWAFRVGAAPDRTRVELAFRGTSGDHLLGARAYARPDVAATHGLAADRVGFEFVVEKSRLPRGRYRLALHLAGDEGVAALRHLPRPLDIA